MREAGMQTDRQTGKKEEQEISKARELCLANMFKGCAWGQVMIVAAEAGCCHDRN